MHLPLTCLPLTYCMTTHLFVLFVSLFQRLFASGCCTTSTTTCTPITSNGEWYFWAYIVCIHTININIFSESSSKPFTRFHMTKGRGISFHPLPVLLLNFKEGKNKTAWRGRGGWDRMGSSDPKEHGNVVSWSNQYMQYLCNGISPKVKLCTALNS